MFLHLYINRPQISNDIKTAINKYNIQYKQTEDDVAKDIPLLFREYFAASDEDREPILVIFFFLTSAIVSSGSLVRVKAY